VHASQFVELVCKLAAPSTNAPRRSDPRRFRVPHSTTSDSPAVQDRRGRFNLNEFRRFRYSGSHHHPPLGV